MTRMIGVCDACGTVFPTGVRLAGNVTVTAVGNRAQCPSCGRMAHIPDGVYTMVGDALTVLTAPERTLDQLRRLAEVLERHRDDGVESLSAAVAAEAPWFASVLTTIKEHVSNHLYKILPIIISTVGVVVAAREKGRPPPVDVDQVINVIIESPRSPGAGASGAEAGDGIKHPAKAGPEPERNDPCPCGSGKKYKRCHGTNS